MDVERILPASLISSDEIGAPIKIKEEVEMKRIVFLIVASLLVLSLVLPGCIGGPQITIAICGPMMDPLGVHMLAGAILAASEINANGGVDIGGTNYTIKLIAVDTDEINNPISAAPAMENAIVNNGAQFVIGGVQTEAVWGMMGVAGCTTTPFFICGNSYVLLSVGTPYYPYTTQYPNREGFKYVFRSDPFNDIFLLLNNSSLMATMVAKDIEGIIGSDYNGGDILNPVRIAIVALNLRWVDDVVEFARDIFGTVAPTVFNWPWELAGPAGNNGTGVWRVAQNISEQDMGDIMDEIADPDDDPNTNDGAHIIFTVLSGPEGVTFGKVKGAKEVRAIAVGLNIEAQDSGYWQKTKYQDTPPKYGAEYEITMGTWAPGVYQTSKTQHFQEAFNSTYHEFPIYTAAAYDMIYTLKAAMESKNSQTADVIIDWLEDPANARVTTTGISAYYPVWDGVTTGFFLEGTGYFDEELPALNSTQITALYGTLGYSPACNFTMPPYTTHDLVYGPTWQTGIGVQWQATGGGTQVGVWPNSSNWTDQNTMSRRVAGINWTNVQYTGITDFIIPDEYCQAWTGSPCP